MVPNRSLNWILLACLGLASCRSFAPEIPTTEPVSNSPSSPDTPTPPADFVIDLHNSEYQLGFTDALIRVQLTNGKYEQGVPGSDEFVSITMTDFAARGDLDNDGRDDFAALVAENYGGSGVFVFLAFYSEVNGKPVYQTSVWVDDRPQINALSFDEHGIFLDVTTHGPDDPMCCPTLHALRHYQLMHGQLDMIDYVTFTPDDRPRTITIESPGDGTEVFHSVQIKGSVAIAPFENNLVYRIFDAGGVEIAIGSIAVSAPDIGAPGTFDEMIELGNILSGAVIRIEVQDQSARDGSLLAMDSVELVVK